MSFSEWKEVKLGEVADVLSGYAFKSKDFCDSGIPVIKIKNITPPYVTLGDVQYVSQKMSEEKKRYKLKYNDILISLTGSNVNQFVSAVGKVGRIKINKPMMLNQRVGKFEILNQSVYSLDFLYYLISTEEMHYKLAINASGAANQANISPSMIKNVDLPCPPIDEQKAIADTLSCLDDKIELNNRINKTLEEMAQAIFKSWFVDFEPFQDGEFEDSELGRIPKGWRVGTLGDIVTLNYGKSLTAKNRIDGKIKVYSSAGITGFHNQALINGPSIIIGRKGTIGTVYYSTEPSFCIDTAYYVTQNDCKFPLLIMYQLLKEFKLNKYNEDSAVPGLNRNTVYAINVIIPPEDILIECYKSLNSIYSGIFDNYNQNQNLTAIRDSLLPKLMSGEIRIPVEEVQ